MKKIIFNIIFCFIITSVFAQGEIDDQPTIALRNELTYAVLINTNGIGGNIRFAQRRDGFRKRLYNLDVVTLRHPKEIKRTSEQFPSTSRYVFGKVNFVMNMRLGYGMQKEIFEKHDKGSISIRYFYNYGPSIAFLKPIYYQIIYNTGTGTSTIKTIKDEKFDPDIHRENDINGKSAVIMGLNEMKVSPGIFAKFGFTFEYSKRDNRFSAVEVGAVVDGYFRKIEIMALQPSDYVLYGLFFSYRWGRILQARSLKG